MKRTIALHFRPARWGAQIVRGYWKGAAAAPISRLMADKRYTKSNLPEKTCEACGRPFAWRKKWERDWDNVKTCSERCKGDLRRKNRAG